MRSAWSSADAAAVEARDEAHRRTTVSALVVAIRDSIMEGRLAPGAKLNVKRLCADYGVSTIPLREALSRLLATGFVEAQDQLGFRVAGVSALDLADITRARILVESEALRLSIQSGSLVWESELIKCHARLASEPMRSAEKGGGLSPAWDDAHMAFHHALIAGCGSPTLLELAANLRVRSTRYRYVSVRGAPADMRGPASRGPVSRERDVPAEHIDLLNAALRRDADRATAMLQAHYETTVRQTLSASAEPQQAPAKRRAGHRS